MYSLPCLVLNVIVGTLLATLMAYGTGTPRAISVEAGTEAILIGAIQRAFGPLTRRPKRDGDKEEDGEIAHFFIASLFASAMRSSVSHIASVTPSQSRT